MLSVNLTKEQRREKNREYRLRYRSKHRQKYLADARNYHSKNRERENAKGRVREARRKARIQLALAGRPKPPHCECCGRESKVTFDHCHASTQFRGWICNNCNAALGHIHDDVSWLMKLIAYLTRSGHRAQE